MSNATYSFLPYARTGIANSIKNDTGDTRGSVSAGLKVKGDSIESAVPDKAIQLAGPGDITAINKIKDQIFRVEPNEVTTSFEPNYLAFVEFYDEDFCWLYTPVPAQANRLNPWITLIVLEEDEFTLGTDMTGRPLHYFTLKNASSLDLFPKPDQLWAWAHVQYNGDITNSDSTIVVSDQAGVDAGLDKLQTSLAANPDLAYSRLISPRKLLPNKTYRGFIIPSYKSGRFAGQGKEEADIAPTKLEIAWKDGSLEYPFYYTWKFCTGSAGDFEYLVRLLKPKVADARVGRRLMDMTDTGSNLEWVEDGDPANIHNGLLRLGGALKVPAKALSPAQLLEAVKNENWALKNYPHPFEVKIANFLNLADDYSIRVSSDANQATFTANDWPFDPNEDSDPIIVPPIYGRWHAMVERVYQDRDKNPIDNGYNWVTELNLDPRFRVSAHFGTKVVQTNQEAYMQASWEQVGEVLAANKQITFAQLALATSSSLHKKHLSDANVTSPAKALLLTAPLQKRVLYDQVTVFQALRESVLPNSFLSTSMRKIIRPRGRFTKRITKKLPGPEHTGDVKLDKIITSVSEAKIIPAPPKTFPPGLLSIDKLSQSLEPKNIPQWVKELLRNNNIFKYLPLFLIIIMILFLVLAVVSTVLITIGIGISAILFFIWRQLSTWTSELKTADLIDTEKLTPEMVDQMPSSQDFKLVSYKNNTAISTGGTIDNENSKRFKSALKDMAELFHYTHIDNPAAAPAKLVNIAAIAKTTLDNIHPEKTLPAWIKQQVRFPSWIQDQLNEGFTEAMAYPKINTPMYAPLRDISSELFLPNIELIEHNSITLLETNQKFIESYMVGLNHEFSRELLWREYPTDQRGSYFRQFWDVSTVLQDPALAGKSEQEKREPYYDIPALHLWKRSGKLGAHDNRQPPNEPPKEEVVLVIRGELLKKYPNAVIYAHKAEWTKNSAGHPDVTKPRGLMNDAEGDKEKPDKKFVQLPLYRADAAPDITFFGFDLTVDVAAGESNPATPNDMLNAGWFFVIKERPGETRFGLDIESADIEQTLITWNDLHWGMVLPGVDQGVIDVSRVTALPDRSDSFFNTDDEGVAFKTQYQDDKNVKWENDLDAASLAYILYQVPVMVCVHASEMLKQN